LDKDGEPIYQDGGHLLPAFVRHQADFIDQTVQTSLPLPSAIRKPEESGFQE
jgi:hypothetical protein